MRRNGIRTGRQARANAAYHMETAAKARARYDEMKVLRAAGKSLSDIARIYGVSVKVISLIFKRYEGARDGTLQAPMHA